MDLQNENDPRSDAPGRSSLFQISCHVAAIPPLLLSDPELCNYLPIAIDVIHSEVIEQTPALTDDLQQPAAGPMIFFVRFEVLSQVGNAFAEQSDLNFRGPCI